MDLQKLKEIMKTRGLDALVAVSPENVYYSAKTYIMTQKSLRERLAYAVFPIDSDPVLIVCGIEESLARAESWIKDIRTYVEFKQTPTDLLISVLKEKKLANSRIGFEKRYQNMEFVEVINKNLSGVQVEECDSIFDYLRAFKTIEEVEILEKGARVTLDAIKYVFSNAKPGDTERKLATEMIKLIFDQGADETGFMVLGTGKRSSIIHPVPEEIPLQKGDIVRVDFGGLFKNYYSDVARTAVVGQPTKRQEHVLRSLVKIEKTVIDNAKAGVRFSFLYNLCKELFTQYDLPFFMPHIGHGMGIGLHEDPMISPLNDNELKENMILNIEPVCIDGEFGYHFEDLILVTKDGPRVLTGETFSFEPIIIE